MNNNLVVVSDPAVCLDEVDPIGTPLTPPGDTSHRVQDQSIGVALIGRVGGEPVVGEDCVWGGSVATTQHHCHTCQKGTR